MPKLQVEGFGTFDVPEGKRLVLAIEEDAQVDILHRCGGNARCTTCRVEFIAGEPDRMTRAERDRLEARELLGKARLSCQIQCTHDMHVKPLMRMSTEDLPDPGPAPEKHITPEPEWIPLQEALSR